MFLITTYLGPSSIQGTGVFTPVDIPQGTRLWEYTPAVDWKLTPEELELILPRLRPRLKTYCYLNAEGFFVLCGDNARFMNHAEDPNCDDPGGEVTIARRDIRAREELTCDYRRFDHQPADGGSGPLFG